MPEILSIYNELFDFLVEWNREKRFASGYINPFFYIRSNNDSRFKDGYWFPGNEKYLCVSFWAGGDSLNKTPNIYFEVTAGKSCRGVLVARDSDDKFAYFNTLLSYLKEYKIPYTNPSQKRKGIWVHEFEKKRNYLDILNEYLEKDKTFIDRFLTENDPREYINDYSSPLGFINANDFETNYSRVRKQQIEIEDANIKSEAKLISVGKIGKEVIDIGDTLTMEVIPVDLPCTIQLIDIKNYQGIKHTALYQFPKNNQWIFITGENGYGKSSVLQAISLGLNDDRVLDNYLADNSRIEILVNNNSTSDTFIRLKNGTSGTSTNFNGIVIAYGPVRLNTFSPESRNSEDNTNNNVMSLFQSTTLLKNIQWELFSNRHTNYKLFEQLEKAVKDATKGRIESIEFDGSNVLFIERLSNDELLPAVPLEKLAAGFRSIINIVGDIIVRFGNKFPSANYKDFYGLVLIDEIENHLHPLLQRELPEALSRVFPKIQFIATTHSPIPLLGAPKESVILTVSRNIDDGITIERLDDQINFANLLPNTILSSPIFGFEDIIPSSNTNISDISTASDFASAEKLDEIKNTLNLKKIDFDAIDTDLERKHNLRSDELRSNESSGEGMLET